MKLKIFFLVLVLLGGLACSAAWSLDKQSPEPADDDAMILKSRGFKSFQRPAVRFDHYRHEEIIQCLVCHHGYVVFGNEDYGQGGECSSCHQEKAVTDNPVPLIQAFHGNCQGCHERKLALKMPTGPVMCGECHQRNQPGAGE